MEQISTYLLPTWVYIYTYSIHTYMHLLLRIATKNVQLVLTLLVN